MKGISFLLFVIVMLSIVAIESCKEADVFVPFDTIEKFEVDSLEIANYITNKGLDESKLDTINGLIIYSVIDEGNGVEIERGDIISYNYILRTTDDSVRLTNIRSVAIENELDSFIYTIVSDTISEDPLLIEADTVDISTTLTYTTEKFTLAPSSWTVNGIFTSATLNAAYGRGLVPTIEQLNIGGQGIIILASESFFGGSEFLSNVVFVIDIYPVFARKPN